VGTKNELFAGNATYEPGPYGLGVRVPMIVISPWTKGGWVNSEVFDHTSLIRFVQRRFGVSEPNITKWRSTVAGDLTSAFNFHSPNDAIVGLPSTASYEPPNQNRYPDYVPAVPSKQTLPTQEAGMRPARALPYELHVREEHEFTRGGIELSFHNTGKAGAVLHVRFGDGQTPPRTYTLGVDDEASDVFGSSSATSYDLAVYGPNGFLRTFAGGLRPGSAKLTVHASYDKDGDGVKLEIRNHGSDTEKISIRNGYTGKAETRTVHAHQTATFSNELHKTFGWYDVTITVESDASFVRQLAGHVENGRASMSDPAIGA
jgi:phospholipase C